MRSFLTRRKLPLSPVRLLAQALLALASVDFSLVLAQPHPQPRAQPHRHPPAPPSARPPAWRGDIQRFHEHDWKLWREGQWRHGAHGGRVGWWWVVGGLWYFYPSPVYPYPNPWEPPPHEYVTPPVGSPPPPPAQHWYYCDSAKGYYPYVPTCPGGWKQVPASPQQ